MSEKSKEILKTLPFPIDGWDIAILMLLKRWGGTLCFDMLDSEVVAEIGWLTPEKWGVHMKKLMDDALIDVEVKLLQKGSDLIL
jgi:hypothetical protein